MPLRPLADTSVADWFVDDTAVTPLRAVLGPPGFESHARVLHAWAGSESGLEDDRYEGHLDDPLLQALVENLAQFTTTPNECFFGLWDGWGQIHGGDAVGFLTRFSGTPRWPGRIFTKEKPPPPTPAAFAPEVLAGPRVQHDHDHLLFEGPLRAAGDWGAASYGHGLPRDINSPSLMWPADHAWFVTTNIDSSWTGVVGPEQLISALLHDARLEVVRARYDAAAVS